MHVLDNTRSGQSNGQPEEENGQWLWHRKQQSPFLSQQQAEHAQEDTAVVQSRRVAVSDLVVR